MPHGLTIDQKGNIWLTDVAMHQVGNKLLAVELFYVNMSSILASIFPYGFPRMSVNFDRYLSFLRERKSEPH